MKQKDLKLFKVLGATCAFCVILAWILFAWLIAPQKLVPILMYHSFTDTLEKSNSLTILQGVFKKQMEHLARHGYKVISLSELIEAINEKRALPQKCVVLTFDDTGKSFYEYAYPILKAHKFKATLFLISGSLKESNGGLEKAQIKVLARDDLIELGSHSISHVLLPLLGSRQKKKEIFYSKHQIETRINKPVLFFAYPFGAADNSTIELVKDAGYKAAVGTIYQRGEFSNDNIYILKRVFLSRISEFPLMFRFMLSGYYVPTQQLILKVLNIKTPRALYQASR
jgi:peptidoglycan/xylan/chitin deacetylase (PgdA/CDA1 family)